MNSDEMAMWKNYIKQKSPVVVYQNDENGSIVWAVRVHGTDFWLNAFEHKEEAMRFCEENDLLVVQTWSDLPQETALKDHKKEQNP